MKRNLSEIKTVPDFINDAADILADRDNYKIIGPFTPILDALTEVAYARAVPGVSPAMTPQWCGSHPDYEHHLRLRGMDKEVQDALKAGGVTDLFQRCDRDVAAKRLREVAGGL